MSSTQLLLEAVQLLHPSLDENSPFSSFRQKNLRRETVVPSSSSPSVSARKEFLKKLFPFFYYRGDPRLLLHFVFSLVLLLLFSWFCRMRRRPDSLSFYDPLKDTLHGRKTSSPLTKSRGGNNLSWQLCCLSLLLFPLE